MHQEKIIICKFNLKNKCLFRHLKVNELNVILNELENLKCENILLKSQLKAKCLKMNNSSNKICDVTNDYVHALEKPLYSSFFKQNMKYKAEFNRINKPLRQIIGHDKSKLNEKADESHERKLDKTSIINSTLNKNYYESVIEAINDYKKVQDEINKKVENELKLIEVNQIKQADKFKSFKKSSKVMEFTITNYLQTLLKLQAKEDNEMDKVSNDKEKIDNLESNYKLTELEDMDAISRI